MCPQPTPVDSVDLEPLRQQMDEFKQWVLALPQSQYWERNVHRAPPVGPLWQGLIG